MANTALRVTELDFFSIRENLKNYLRSQDQFTDFDFEGSGMAVLLDILAYNTHYAAVQLNLIGNEMFLDTAQLRPSLLSHAKSLNYTPSSKHGAVATINITCTPTDTENQEVSTLTISKYTRFLGVDIDGINYPFVTPHTNTAIKVGNSFSFANLQIKQGEVVTLQFRMTPENTSRRFVIPSSNVDVDTITVTVTESSTNTYTEEYSRVEDITTVRANSTVYWVEENEDLTYTLYFGDDILGKKPKNGNIITCTYIDTMGSKGNKVSQFVLADALGGLFRSNVSITTANSSYGGTDKETIEEVRFRAPYFYTTQNRAVTQYDYETLITKDFNNIQYVSVWGGEDNDPVVYGKVFLSLKPKRRFVLTNLEKELIKDTLIRTRNVMTVTPEIVDPDYTYILIKGTVTYDPHLTTKTPNEILEYVKAAIGDYNTAELGNFRSYFRKSKLQTYIEACDPSITGSDLKIYAQKRFLVERGSEKSYTLYYNTPIQKGSYSEKLYSYPELQSFDQNGVSRNIYFEEVPLSATGVESITILNSGSGYFSTPTVTIVGDGTGAITNPVVRNGRIEKIDILSPGINYTKAEVVISGSGGAEAVARLAATTGILRSYYFKNTGEKVIVNSNVGTINYNTGEVFLRSILTTTGTPAGRYYDQDIVTIAAPIEKEIISPLRNRIIIIDENDPAAMQIEVVPQ